MAEGLINDYESAQGKAQLERIKSDLGDIVKLIADANAAGRKAEFGMGQAASIKQISDAEKVLVDAQGQLIGSTSTLTKTLAEAAAVKARYNGTTQDVLKTGQQLIRLNAEEEKAQQQVNKALQEGEKVRTQAAKTANEASKAILNESKAQTEAAKAAAVRTKSLIDQEKELDRLIAKEAKAAQEIAKQQQKSAVSAAPNDSLKALSETLDQARKSYALFTQAERENEHIGGVRLARIQELDAALKAADSTQGKYTRNVGHYQLATDGVVKANTNFSRSLGIISGEFTNLAYGARTFFSSLSNNILPAIESAKALIEQLKEAKIQGIANAEAEGIQAKATALAGGATEEAANQIGEMAKEQALATLQAQKGGSVLGALGKSLFSFSSLIGFGVAALTIFGPKIFEWISSLFKGKNALDELTKSEEAEYETRKKINEEFGKEVSRLDLLKEKIENVNIPMAARLQAVKDIKELLPSYFDQLTNEALLAGRVGDAYDKARESIQAAARVRVFGDQLGTAEAQIATLGDRIRAEAAKARIELQKSNLPGSEGQFNPQAANDAFGRIPSYKTGEKDKQGKAIRTTLYNDIVKYNEQLRIQSDLTSKIQANQPKASATDKIDDPKKVKDTSAKDARDRQKEIDADTKLTLEKQRGRFQEQAVINRAATEDEKKSLNERLTAFDKYMLDEISIAKLTGSIQGDTAEEIQAKITEIVYKFSKGRTELIKKEGEEQTEFEKKNLADLVKFGSNTQVGTPKGEKKEDKDRFKALGKYSQEGVEFAQNLSSVESSLAERRIQEIDAEIEAINKKRDAEIDAINVSALSATEKEQKITDAKARAEAKTKELENSRRQQQYRAAVFEKGVTVAQIIATTGLAAIKQVAAVPLPAGALPLAAVLALGVSQLAAAIAAPLPAYAEGTDGQFVTGKALTDEKGPEGYFTKSGKFYTGSDAGPTVRMFNEPTKIISNDELMQLSRMYGIGMPILQQGAGQSLDTQEIKKGLKEVTAAIRDKKETTVNFHNLGIQHLAKIGNSSLNFLHNIKGD